MRVPSLITRGVITGITILGCSACSESENPLATPSQSLLADLLGKDTATSWTGSNIPGMAATDITTTLTKGLPPGLLGADLLSDLIGNNPADTATDRSSLAQAFSNVNGNPNNLSQAGTPTVSVTPVPTPALLPGLIGIGVATWRKRKGALAISSEKEA